MTSNSETYLTEKERALLGERDQSERARALSEVAQIAAHFNVPDQALEQIVASSRELLEAETKPGKVAKRAKKARRLIEAIIKYPQLQEPLEPAQEPIELPASQPLPADIAESEPFESDIVPQVIEAQELPSGPVSPQGLKFLQTGLGDTWWRELGFAQEDEATAELVAERMTQNMTARKPNSPERVAAALVLFLQGVGYGEIGQRLAILSPYNLSATFMRLRDQRRWQQEGHIPQPPKQNSVPVAVVPVRPIPKPPTVDLKSAEDVLRQKQEQAKELGRKVAQQWSSILELGEDDQWALDSLLSFENFDEISPLEKNLIHRIVNFVNDHYPVDSGSVLEHPSLDLDETQQMYLRKLTGRWYTKSDKDMTRQPVRILNLTHRRSETSLTEIATSIYVALEQLGARHTATPETTA